MSDIVINTGSISGEITPKAAVTDGEVVRGRSLTGEVDRNVNANKDYERLINKPQINGVELVGDLSTEDLHIKTSELDNDAGFIDKDVDDLTNYYDKTAIDGALQQVGEDIQSVADSIPTDLSQLNDDTTHRTVTDADIDAWNAKSDFSGSYNDLTDKPDIPSALSDLTEDTTHRVVTDAEKTTWNGKSDFSGDYDDLTNKPEIPSELADLTEDATHRVVTDTEKQTWNGKSNVTANPENATETLTSIDIDGTKYVIPQGGGGGDVQSVNGKTGVVILDASDVGALPNDTPIPAAQIQSDWEQSDNTQKDYIKNKPTIPAAQVNSDWNASSGVAQILNKPTLGTAAAKDAPVSGDASASQVVMGDDSRLTDARTPVSHTHTLSDITDAGTAASHDATNAVVQGSGDLVTSGAVWTAIDNLPEPLIFKGTLGAAADSPTITVLPTASAANEGYLYLVITAGTYASIVAKVGDRFACATLDNGTTYQWILLPAGDSGTDTDTWRNIKVNGTEKLGSAISTGGVDFVNGTNTTVSFDANGNKIKIDATDTTYDPATQSADGLMSSTDKTKLDGIESGAQANAVTSVAGKTGAVSLEKSDVGLGNVPNVATDDQTPTVTEASSRTNIASGDTLKTIIGKIKKFFADLKTVAFTGAYSDLSNKPTKLSDFTDDVVSGNYLPLSGGTVDGYLHVKRYNTTTPFSVDGTSTSAYMAFRNADGTALHGSIGVHNDKLPYINSSNGTKRMALLEEVKDGTLTIKRNNTSVGTFTANQSTASNINIECATPSDIAGSKTASGSVVTVTDAAPIYAEQVDVAVVATQSGSGTPSPSNIRPIQGYDIVSVDRCGKNLLNPNALGVVRGKTILTDGTLTDASYISVSDYIPVKNNATLTLKTSAISIGGYNRRIVCFDNNKQYLGTCVETSGNPLGEEIITGTVIDNTAFVRVPFLTTGLTNQLEEGSTATTYESYNGQTVSLQLGNKNLLPMTVEGIKAANTSGSWSGNVYTINNATFTVNTDENGLITGIKINTNGAVTTGVTFNVGTNLSYNAGNYILSTGDTLPSGLMFAIQTEGGNVTVSNANSANVTNKITNSLCWIYIPNTVSVSNYTIKPMLRSASVSDSTFSPYNPTLGGMVYGGQLTLNDDGSAVFVGDRACVDMGTSTAIEWENAAGLIAQGIFPFTISTANYVNQVWLSEAYNIKYQTNWNMNNNEIIVVKTSTGAVGARLENTNYTTLASLKTSLTGIKLVYALATPFTLHLSAEQLKLLQGTNNVWSNAGDVTLKYQPDNVIAEPKADVQRLRDDVDDRLVGNASKNRWNFEDYLNYCKTIDSNLTWTKSDDEYSINNIGYLINAKYSFNDVDYPVAISIKMKGNATSCYILGYDINGTETKRVNVAINANTYTDIILTTNCSKVLISYGGSGGSVVIKNPQIEIGSSPTAYEEYYPSNRELGERGSVVSLATNKGSSSGDSFTLTNITNFAFLQFVLCREFMPYYCLDEVILPSSKVSTLYGTNNKIFLRSKESTTIYAVVSFASATSATVNIYNVANNEKVFIFGIK